MTILIYRGRQTERVEYVREIRAKAAQIVVTFQDGTEETIDDDEFIKIEIVSLER